MNDHVKRGDRVAGKVVLVTGAGSIGPGWGNGKAAYAREGAGPPPPPQPSMTLSGTESGTGSPGAAASPVTNWRTKPIWRRRW